MCVCVCVCLGARSSCVRRVAVTLAAGVVVAAAARPTTAASQIRPVVDGGC